MKRTMKNNDRQMIKMSGKHLTSWQLMLSAFYLKNDIIDVIGDTVEIIDVMKPVYKRANLDRKLFSKIRNQKSYKPSRGTAIALVIALELNMEETRDLLARTGIVLCKTNKSDVIVAFFIENKQYDMSLINEALEYYGLPILGERKS